MATKQVSLDALSEADVQRLMAQIKAAEQAEKDAAEATKDAQKALIEPVALTLIAGFAPREFSTGSQGWQVPVSVEVEGHGKVTGQLLLTIKSTVKK